MAEQHQTVTGDYNVTVENLGDGNSFQITIGAETGLEFTRKHSYDIMVALMYRFLLQIQLAYQSLRRKNLKIILPCSSLSSFEKF